MSFRKVGGLQYSATQNIVRSRYNTSDSLYVTQNVGQPNSYINFDSDISGNIIIYGDLDVSGNLHVLGDIDCSGNLNIDGNIDCSGNVDINGYLHVQQDIDCSGNLYTNQDAYINSVRVGRGAGNDIRNTVVGNQALNANISGNDNTAVGYYALQSNIGGDENTAVGYYALLSNEGGSENTALGFSALVSNTNGINNVAIGHSALASQTINSSFNTALGYEAGFNNKGLGNTFLGFKTNVSNPLLIYNQSTAIGYQAIIDASNQIVLGTSTEKIKIPGSYVGIGGVYNPGGLNNYNVDLSGNLQIFGNILNVDNTKSEASLRIVSTAASAQNTVVNSAIITYLNGYELGYAATRSVNAGVNSFMGMYPDSLGPGNYNNLVKQGDHVMLWGNYPFGSTVTAGFVICPWQISSNGLRMDPNGNIGINKQTPTFRLDVSGNLGTTMDASINSITVGRGGGDQDTNTAIGFEALKTNTTAVFNTAVGYQALQAATSSNNTALGYKTLFNNTGTQNTGLGQSAGFTNVGGISNTYVGYGADCSTPNLSGSTAIGYNSKVSVSNQIVLGIANQKVFIPGIYLQINGTYTDYSASYALYVNGNAYATSYSNPSDYRIKQNVKILDETFTVDSLNPVTYFNKKTEKQDIGLIAHELQEIYPFLVTGEKDGENLQAVNYIGLIGILIKEIQELKKEVKILKSNPLFSNNKEK